MHLVANRSKVIGLSIVHNGLTTEVENTNLYSSCKWNVVLNFFNDTFVENS